MNTTLTSDDPRRFPIFESTEECDRVIDGSIGDLDRTDPDADPPESWPAWADEDRWELSPEPQPYVPSPEDWAEYCEWCRKIEARDRDREEGLRWIYYFESLADKSKFTDEDLERCGLPVG